MAQGKSTLNRIARYVGLGLLVGGCLFVLLWNPPEPEVEKPRVIRPAKLFEVATLGDTVSRSYSAVVNAANQVDLAFRVSGPLVELPITRGKELESGELIARIDPRDFQTQLDTITGQLEEARAKLVAMKAGERAEVVARLENQLRAAEADLGFRENEVLRYKQLLDDDVVSQSEYERYQLRRDSAKETMEAAQQELAQAKKGARKEDIDAQEATIRGLEATQRDARNQLADTDLRAPFKGRIARQYVENFQEVKAGEPIVSLQDVSAVEIVADIPEAVIAVVKKEDVAGMKVTFPSVPDREFEVEVKEMETESDARTQTYALTVTMPAPEDLNLFKGTSAELHVSMRNLGGLEQGVLVPVTAVMADEAGNPLVWIAKPSSADEGVYDVERKEVTVSEMGGDKILVTTGLTGGELVVTAGVHFLDDETRVRRLRIEK